MYPSAQPSIVDEAEEYFELDVRTFHTVVVQDSKTTRLGTVTQAHEVSYHHLSLYS